MTKFSNILPDVLADAFQDILQDVFQPGFCHICGTLAPCYPERDSGLSYCLHCLEDAVIMVQYNNHSDNQPHSTQPHSGAVPHKSLMTQKPNDTKPPRERIDR